MVLLSRNVSTEIWHAFVPSRSSPQRFRPFTQLVGRAWFSAKNKKNKGFTGEDLVRFRPPRMAYFGSLLVVLFALITLLYEAD
ncbi:hypothetical protein VTO42DRAFT_2348 [Malbranchea cinnamomea]